MSRDQAVDIAATHYESLRLYLSSYLQSQRAGNGPSNQRSSAREKLTRLTKQQFTELSTDVFDEMNRRQLNSHEAPFLAVDDSFHPKRNQARQKLATLPSTRFKDLASDVYFEIERRFPMVVQQYNSKYGEKAETRGASGSSGDYSEPEPKKVQVVNTTPQFGGVQTYETQYSEPHRYDDRRGQEGGGGGHSGQGHSRHGSTGGQKSADAVNFTSLDNLMADLGSMLTYPKDGNGNDAQPSSEALEKIRAEYENRLDAAQQRIEQLEAECAGNTSRADKIAQLEMQLKQEKEFSAEQSATLNALEAKHAKLTEDFESLQDDYNNQQQIANDIRLEATNLLEEIRNLSRKNDELRAEKERDAQLIHQLRQDSDHGARHESLRSSYQQSRRDHNSMAEPARNDLDHDEDGIIDRTRITTYQKAVDELLQAARSDTPTSVLVAMKGIVIACKNITEDTEAFENSSDALSPDERDQLADTKNQLSAALTNLMGAAKTHATSYGSANVADLDAAATGLTATIVELVKLLKLKPTDNYDDNGGGRSKGGDSGYAPSRKERPSSYEIDELKIFLEKQTDLIVQAIQTLLYAMRQSTSFGQDFKDNISGITSIVENLVGVSRQTLSKPSATDFRTRGEMILQDLASANDKLEELGESMMNSPQSKTLKQRLASSSYEIAKYVKELISLIE